MVGFAMAGGMPIAGSRSASVRALVGLAGVVTVGTVLAVRLARKTPGLPDEDRWLAAWLVVGLVDVVAGASLVRRLGHRRLAGCLLLVGVAAVAAVAAATTADLVPSTRRFRDLVDRDSWAHALAAGTLIALVPWELAPTSRQRRYEVVWWSSASVVVLVTAGYALGLPGSGFDAVDVGVIALSVSATAAVTRLVARWWRQRGTTVADPTAGWIVVGACGTWLAVVPAWLDAIPEFPDDGTVGPAVLVATLPLLIVGVAVRALRERPGTFYGLAHEVIAWFFLSGAILLVYTGVVAGVGRFVGGTGRTWLLVMTTGVIAVSVEPARRRLQATVDRLVWGARDEPLKVVRDVLGHLSADTVDTLLPSVAESLRRELRLDAVAIDVRTEHGWRRAASAGAASTGSRRVVDLVQRGEVIGRLEVGWQDGPHLRRRDEQVVRELEGPLTVAVGWVQLLTELRGAGTAIVSARDQERRRIRRDLHDGLGPALTGVSLALRTAVRKLDRDDPSGVAQSQGLLQRAADDVDAMVLEVKRIVRDLNPSALDRLGLVEAVDEFARQFASVLEFHLELPDRAFRMPADVEKAVYLIVAEAVTNVVRHSGAAQCWIRIVVDDDVLRFDVRDDGSGLGDLHVEGAGLPGIRERAAELGGTASIRCDGSGTTVSVELPRLIATAP